MYNGELSIFKETLNPQPIIPRNKNELAELLNSTAKLERLSLKSINDNPPTKDRYFLEPIPSEMFLMFADSENPTIVYDESPNVLKLLSSGSLSVDNDEEFDEDEAHRAVVTPYSLNLEEYRKRRAEQNSVIDLSDSASNTPLVSNSQEQSSDPAQVDRVVIEEEFAPNTQDVNDMIESILGPHSAGIDDAQPTGEENTATAPTTTIEPNSPKPALSTPTLTEPVTTEPLSNISTDVECAIANDWINDDEIYITDSQAQISSSSQPIYGFAKKIIPVFPTLEQRSECDKTTEASRTKTNLFFNMHFEKSISSLNLPSSNVDYTPEEQWVVSGKLMVLKRLFDSLLDKDIILLIVVKDMGEEEMLMELIKDNLKLDCVRMNYVVQDWEGEYGVFIKTKSQVDQQRGRAERGSNFEAVADFIISLDIRAKSDESLLKVVTKRNSPDLPPTACLISIGSIEERAFKFLENHNLVFADSKSDEFKDLLRQENEWPENNEKNSIAKLNFMVAENIKSWMLSEKRKEDHYQYRSLFYLPRSTILGIRKTDLVAEATVADPAVVVPTSTEPTIVAPTYVQPPIAGPTPVVPNVIPTVVAAESSDMEVESDSDQLSEIPILSEKGIEFIKNSLFPPFDISKGELPEAEAEPILRTLPESDIRRFSLLPPLMQTEYKREVANLKRQYEEAFQNLQHKFREKAFKALRKQ